MNENWLPVVGWEGYYEVSDQGRVRSLPRDVQYPGGWSIPLPGRELQSRLRGRYARVSLSVNGRRSDRMIHHLVLEAFVGARPAGMLACHRDDDRSNNSASNLYWGTPAQNNRDAVENGRIASAVKSHCVHGHPLSGSNLYVTKTGARMCKSCRAARMRRYKSERGERALYADHGPGA